MRRIQATDNFVFASTTTQPSSGRVVASEATGEGRSEIHCTILMDRFTTSHFSDSKKRPIDRNPGIHIARKKIGSPMASSRFLPQTAQVLSVKIAGSNVLSSYHLNTTLNDTN